MGFALQHRQAIVVRANAAGEDGVAVVEQMVGGNGGCGEAVAVCHVLGGFPRSDVLKDDLELRKVFAQRDKLRVDKHGFAVKQVDIATGHLTVHQEQQAGLLHGFQRFVGLAQVGDPGVAVGGGTGGVELGGDHTGVFSAGDLVSGQVIRQVQRHQRLKLHPFGHGGLNARLVGQGLGGGGHRRPEVGHDDGAGELGGGVRHHGVQGCTVAHMQVPVVGTGDGEGWLCHRFVLNQSICYLPSLRGPRGIPTAPGSSPWARGSVHAARATACGQPPYPRGVRGRPALPS